MKITTNKIMLGTLLVVFALVTILSVETRAEGNKPTGGSIGAMAIAIATVVDIDQETREVTLKNEEGEKKTFTAGPEVRNFDQIKRGDFVLAEFFTGLAIALEPKGSGVLGRVDEVVAKRAKEGDKPGLSIGQISTASGIVEAVDTDERTVTVKGPDNTLTLSVADDVDLSNIKKGMPVEAVFLTYYAVSVEPAPKVSGTIKLTTTAVAAGVGFEWGEGTLTMYDGTTHTFKVKGLSLIDVGVTRVEAEGKVYHLVEASDLEGKYLSGAAGATFVAGGSVTAMKNRKGVVLQLTSTQKGLKLTLAPGGLSITQVK